MNEEKWEEIINKIGSQFGIEENGQNDLPDARGNKEWVVFTGPLGRMKLERTTKPRVIREDVKFTKRLGSDVSIKKVYDTNNLVNFIKLYKWNEGINDWEEMKENIFNS